jgi:hypothetical protein
MVNCVATLGVVVFSYAGLADTNRSDTHQVHQHQQPHVPTPATHPNGSPNVLLLLVDDLRPMLPFYGTDRMKAPNLAKLAACLGVSIVPSAPICSAGSIYGYNNSPLLLPGFGDHERFPSQLGGDPCSIRWLVWGRQHIKCYVSVKSIERE